MLIKIGLWPAIILRPPDVLRAEEPSAAHSWVGPDWNIEGHVLAAITAWIPNPGPSDLVAGVPGKDGVPRAGIAAIEVVGRDNLRQEPLAEQREHPDVRIRDIDAPVSAVTEEGNEPAGVRRAVPPTESLGAVVLCPAHDLVERILHIQRKALELKRRQASVHRSDRGRYLR